MNKEKEHTGMVLEQEDIQYMSFGALYFPDTERKKERAWAYMFAVNAFNNIGAGADENLSDVRAIIRMMKTICLLETGYIIPDSNEKQCGSEWGGWKQNPFAKHKEKQ